MKKNLLLKIGLVFEYLMAIAWFLWGTLFCLGALAFSTYNENNTWLGAQSPQEELQCFCFIFLVYLFISFVFVTSIILTTKLVQKKEISKISQILLPFMVIGEIWLTIWSLSPFFK